jgi:ABC-type polysaccharide/polyol phosphate export permease
MIDRFDLAPPGVAVQQKRPTFSAQLARYVELCRIISSRTLKTRYRGSILGVYWSLSNPILMTAVYSVIFGTGFARYYDNSIAKYVFATFTGLGILNIFSNTTSQALPSVVTNGSLLNKVRLPVSVFPISAVASNFFQFFVGTFPVFCIVAALNTHSPVHVIALVFPCLAMILVTTGFALALSALYVFFRDLPYMYELGLFVIWITSPIFYPPAIVPAKVQPFLAINPLVVIVTSLRQIALTRDPIAWNLIGASLATGFVCLVAGAVLFRTLKPHFMDLL